MLSRTRLQPPTATGCPPTGRPAPSARPAAQRQARAARDAKAARRVQTCAPAPHVSFRDHMAQQQPRASASAPRLDAATLLNFLPSSPRQRLHTVEPAAALGLLAQHLLQPTREEAKVVLGFPGTKVAARAAQVAMLTVLLLTLSSVTGLGFALSLAVIVAVVGGVSILGIATQRLIARRRMRGVSAAASRLRYRRRLLGQLETYLTNCRLEGDLHLSTLRQTRRAIAQLDATWMHLVGEAVSNAKLPLITFGMALSWAFTRSRPGQAILGFLRRHRLLPRNPVAA